MGCPLGRSSASFRDGGGVGNCRSFQVPEFDAQPHSDKLAATADEQDECQKEC